MTGTVDEVRAEDRVRLPAAPEEITPEWLTEALRIRHPGVTVTAVHLGEVLWGTATKVRILVSYDSLGHAAGLPATLVVKAGFASHELAADMLSFYRSEVHFYRDVAPTLDIGLPRCYFAGMDSERGRAIVVLEDLYARNATFAPAGVTVPVDLVARGLAQQARFHGMTWDRTDLGGLGVYPAELRGILLQVLGGEYWDRCLAKPRARAMPAVLREPGAMKRAIELLWEFDGAHGRCLAHGDAHIGNLFLERDGSPNFVDWQMAGRGHWAHDVAYFTISSLSTEDRRAHERDLVAHYLGALARLGVPAPDLDEAWDAYRRHAVHGLFWMANADGMYPEEVNTAVATRFATAVADLDSVTLLGC